jgi:hypothetical protein
LQSEGAGPETVGGGAACSAGPDGRPASARHSGDSGTTAAIRRRAGAGLERRP